MHVRVPTTRRHIHRPALGYYGLGDDGTDTTFDPTTVDTSTITDPFANTPIDSGLVTDPSGLMTGTPLPSVTTGYGPGGLFTADQQNLIESGQVPTGLTSAQVAALTPYYSPVGTLPVNPNSSNLAAAGFNPSQISSILSSAAQAAIASYKAVQQPGLIPGTNLVYNPSSGQILNASGSLTASTSGLTASGSGITILLLLGLGVVLIMSNR